MKRLTKADELIGKTIESTYGLVTEDEEIVIIFKDNTFAVLTVWEDSAGLGLDEDPITPLLAKKAGLITEEEFDNLMEEESKRWAARQEEAERRNLRRFMEKYPDEVVWETTHRLWRRM